MRSHALILVLAVILAGLMGGPGLAARRVVAAAPATAREGGLRGPIAALAPRAGPLMSPIPAPAGTTTVTPPTAAPPGETGDCRRSCARSYYFCLSGQDPDSCPSGWTQCLADCRQPLAAAVTPP